MTYIEELITFTFTQFFNKYNKSQDFEFNIQNLNMIVERFQNYIFIEQFIKKLCEYMNKISATVFDNPVVADINMLIQFDGTICDILEKYADKIKTSELILIAEHYVKLQITINPINNFNRMVMLSKHMSQYTTISKLYCLAQVIFTRYTMSFVNNSTMLNMYDNCDFERYNKTLNKLIGFLTTPLFALD